MPTDKQIGRASASEYVSRTPRSPLARGNHELPLPKPVGSAIQAAKSSESGEYRQCPIREAGGNQTGDMS